MHRVPVEQTETTALASETDVFGERAKRNEVDFLVDGADALMLGVLRRTRLERPAVEHNLAVRRGRRSPSES